MHRSCALLLIAGGGARGPPQNKQTLQFPLHVKIRHGALFISANRNNNMNQQTKMHEKGDATDPGCVEKRRFVVYTHNVTAPLCALLWTSASTAHAVDETKAGEDSSSRRRVVKKSAHIRSCKCRHHRPLLARHRARRFLSDPRTAAAA